MRASAGPREANKVKLQIELEESEVDKAMDQAFKKVAEQVRIPGFRPGKAPRKVLESHVGADAVRAQALNDCLPDYYVQALHETDTDAINRPTVEITQGQDSGPVTFEAEVEVRPVPNLAGYQGLKVEVPNPVPGDDDVDQEIERLRGQFAEMEEVDRAAQPGDFVTIDINGTSDGEPVPGLTATDYSYEVGNKLLSLGEDFDGQVDGASAGDVKEFESTVPPNDANVSFRVEVKVVNERKLPELNDEWANEASEFETLEELRADISKQLVETRKAQSEQALRTGVIKAVAELVDDEIPEVLVDQEAQRQIQDIANRLSQQGVDLGQFLSMTGQTQEDFLEQIKVNAADSVRADLALRALADKEDLQADDDDVEKELQLLAEQYGQKPAKIRRELEHAEQMPGLLSDIRKAKSVTWLMDNVEIVDAEGQSVDRASIRIEEASESEQSSASGSDAGSNSQADDDAGSKGEATA